jgi:hypothetical protein
MKTYYFRTLFLLIAIAVFTCAEDSGKISISLKNLSAMKNAYEVNLNNIVDKDFECLLFIDRNVNDSLSKIFGDSIIQIAKSLKNENSVFVILLNTENGLVYSELVDKPAISFPFSIRNRKYCIREYKFVITTDKAGSKKFILPFKKI